VADKLARIKLARAALRLNTRTPLPAVILMTDDARLPDPISAARALPRGSMVIVRSRNAETRRVLTVALKPVARARKLKILVADDPKLASEVDGLHLPEVRAHEAAHWRALHPHWIITVAAHARPVRASGANAILLSPIFRTASHPNAPALGVARARLIAQKSLTPIYALGGIDSQNIASLRGFWGVAAISALA
jgi:thiamine-phosphate pyrophosphorylase